jgi:HD-GYP domain-containing protein (c-di-GMP phosphodiesterase class II)
LCGAGQSPKLSAMDPFWPADRRRRDPSEWQLVLRDVDQRRVLIARTLAEAGPASPSELEAVLERLHVARPALCAHVRRVAVYASATARELRLPVLACIQIGRAALVHDLGKLALPDALRTAAGPFTTDELMLVRSHSTIGAGLAHGVPYLRMTAPLVLNTHERFGGGGHPAGLAGEAIPLGARVIAVADAWDAFAGAPDQRDDGARGCANVELMRHAGPHFDPAVVRAWLRVSETLGC